MANELLRTGTILIDDCTKEQMYQVLAALVVNIEELREKDPPLADLRTYYRMLLACQLIDWKAGKRIVKNDCGLCRYLE